MFTFIDLSCRYVLWALSFNPSRFWQTNYLFAYSFWQIYLSFVKFNKVFEISLSILRKFSKRKHRVVKLPISFWIDWFLHLKQMGKWVYDFCNACIRLMVVLSLRLIQPNTCHCSLCLRRRMLVHGRLKYWNHFFVAKIKCYFK